MSENLDAVYQGGAFLPVNGAGISLPEGARVRLTVNSFEGDSVEDEPVENVLDLAAKVYVGLSDVDVAEIESIASDRSSFFSK